MGADALAVAPFEAREEAGEVVVLGFLLHDCRLPCQCPGVSSRGILPTAIGRVPRAYRKGWLLW